MESLSGSRITHYVSRITYVLRFALLFWGGLAFTRILYELFFPRLLWLGRPFPAIAMAITAALLAEAACYRVAALPCHPVTLSPLLLNLIYLFDPAVDLVRSRFIFAASVWVTAVLLTHVAKTSETGGSEGHPVKQGDSPPVSPLQYMLFLLAALIPVYFLTMPITVGRADTFEFQVVAPQLGIAHPTGYPLYLLLGKLFTLVPVGSVAWRLNVGTAVFALIAVTLLYQLGRRLLGKPLPALLGAVALGLTPTFWSQAIEAEVYSLHALVIVAALLLMQVASGRSQFTIHNSQFTIHHSLFFLIGLGLANHLTAIFLLPPAALTLLFAYRSERHSSIFNLQSLFKLTLAFLLPLTLYAYLPIRWMAVNGEAMGLGRFVDWVIGGRFQGALQWGAWLRDPTRYEVVGRLFLDNWGWINLSLALIGLIYIFVRRWRMGLILLVTWLGYTFYTLNYYVPDLAVFLIPAQIIVAIWWMGGATAVFKIGDWRLEIGDWRSPSHNRQSLISGLLIIPILLSAVANWPQINRSQDDGLTEWGQGVLALPLADNAAILADSEKIAPLYYLQQVEGIRPDLEIMVLPDEAAYRAELDGRVAAGQTVYLARFLPGLEGIAHLRSVGPLTEVSTQPMTELLATAVPTNLDFGGIQLIGYQLEESAAVDGTKTAVTLYWQTNQPTNQLFHVYVRWDNQSAATGQHPANNYYPIPAWDVGEIVSDYHLLPYPVSDQTQRLKMQVALAPPFTPPDALAWQTVTTVTLPAAGKIALERPYRAQIGDTLLDGIQFPAQIRPQQPLPIAVSGYGTAESLVFSLQSPVSNLQSPIYQRRIPRPQSPFTWATEIETEGENGRYQLIASQPHTAALCGWFQPVTDGCALGQVEISGVPLPANATNYEDKIALLAINLPQTKLQPGGQLPVTLAWQSLAPIHEDYTVFIQILDANDRLVGQVDAWPLQGTHPTSQWTPGETVNDPYLIQLDSDLPSGQYRLLVGWYLLADLRRLPVLNDDGAPVDDKLLVPGLIVP